MQKTHASGKLTLRYFIFRHIYMGGKSSSQSERFLPDFSNCIHVCSCFSSICSTYTVKCDRISKISQNVQNLGFFEKLMGFSKKPDFLKIARGSKFAVACVSNIIFT